MSETTILADIGGTHARFTLLEKGTIKNPEKRAVNDFPDIETALRDYAPDCKNLMIATAAQPDDKNIWHMANNDKWVINPDLLKQNGWHLKIIMNDFAASARGALADSTLITLRAGHADDKSPCAIIGPGTGLGLAYMIPLPRKKWHIQQTCGAHMMATTMTDEQHTITKLTRRLYTDQRIITFEDVASGRALPFLYGAVCMHNGVSPVFETTQDILGHADNIQVMQTLRLFHEFLGLFAHNVVVTGHTFGGLYLDGGITQRLYKAGLFDMDTFIKFMMPRVTPMVRKRLEAVPIHMVNDPFVALRGLAEMAKDGA